MKRILPIAIAFGICALSLSSCKNRCSQCTRSGSANFSICLEDYKSRFEYYNIVQQAELVGYNCKEGNDSGRKNAAPSNL
jgi:hypothetical protein